MSLSVLLASKCEDNIETLKRGLTISGFKKVNIARSQDDLMALVTSGESFDLSVIQIGDAFETDLELLSSIRESFPMTDCIVVSSLNDADLATECFRMGASDFITMPFSKDTFSSRLKKVALYRTLESTRPQILIMEDDPVSSKLMQKYLEPYGDCTPVFNGIDAVQVFEQAVADGKMYQIIILDIMVPEMHGKDVLRSIREIEKRNGVPANRRSRIIMTTALSDTSNVVESFKSRCDAYLVKPIDRKVLIQEIADLGFGAFLVKTT
jgi:two-component system chemotaxis response regulator CheY